MAMRYPGGFISSTAPTVNANTAKGVWTLEEAMQYIRAGQWPVPTGNGDPYFQYNTMLLPGQGTNGANNNTFLDSSTNNFTITRNGNTTQGTFTPFSGAAGYWGNYLGTTSNYFYLNGEAGFAFGASADFTIEFFFYANSFGGDVVFYDSRPTSTNGVYATLYYNNSSKVISYVVSSADRITGTSVISTSQWHHVVLTRLSGNTKLFVNGVQQGSTYADTNNYLNPSGRPTVCASGFSATGYLDGYISNFRVLNGTGFTSVTVPTSPFAVNTTNQILLIASSNRFIDANTATTAKTVNVGGSPAVTPFQPFGAPTVAYSASTIGGSGYFDGTGDFLSVANNAAFNFGSGAFTIEFWYYPTTLSGTQCLITNYGGSTTGFVIQMGGSTAGSGKIDAGFSGDGADITSTNAVKLNSWNHIAISGTPGATGIKLFINGAQEGSTYTGATSLDTSSTLLIGEVASTNRLSGYLSGLRLLKGTAQYTTTFTPPTEPPTAIANTSLLLNYTNAGIIDNAQDNVLETVNNAQISTTQYKWGASSVAFDGTTDYLIPNGSTTNLFAFGSGAFTIEMWFYVTSFPNQYVALYDSRPASTNGFYPVISLENNGSVYFYVNSANAISSGSGVVSTGRWYHLAVVKAGSSTKMFVNGNQVGSTYADTNTYLIAANRPVIGAGGFTLGNDSLNGYIQDLRITKGYSRYPYNFTAPTAALPLFWQAAATPSSDPYFNYTTLLLPGNGTNGAQNNTFLDSSTNAFTITRNGNTTQGTFTPFSQTGWGNFFDGSGDYLTVASSADFNIFNGDMTFECWFYSTAASLGSRSEHLFAFVQDATNREALYFNGTTLTFWTSSSAGNGPRITYANTPQNQWIHVAVTKSGSTFTMYINGVSVGTSTTTQYSTSNQSLQIGTYNNAGTAADSFTGYISNVRVVKGTNVYTTNFIPSTTPLTPVTNTVLLTCQSNRFIDTNTQTTAKTVTPSGDTSVQAFSPFNPTAAYSTSTVGGSGYFDGTGDYLTAASNSAFAVGSAFTIEFWLYPTAYGANPVFIFLDESSGGLQFGLNSGNLGVAAAGVAWRLTGSAGPTLNAWNHCVLVRSGTGSNQTSIFLNGTRIANGTVTDAWTTNVQAIIQSTQGTSYLTTGYMSNIRIVKGTAVYDPTQSTLTVPTAPLTAVSGTSLLLSGTNGGIIDNTAKNNLETVGGASISTAVSKFGGSSMYFDGTGDYLYRPYSPLFALGTGDFTIEWWMNPDSSQNSTSAIFYFFSGVSYFIAHNNLTAYPNVITVYVDNYGGGTRVLTGTTTLSSGTWYHVAITRYSGVWNLYVNGVLQGSTYTNSAEPVPSSAPLYIGSGPSTGFKGYLQDFRVTKGIARYTTNFTPPTTAFLTL